MVSVVRFSYEAILFLRIFIVVRVFSNFFDSSLLFCISLSSADKRRSLRSEAAKRSAINR